MSQSKSNKAPKKNKKIDIQNEEFSDYGFIMWLIDYSTQDFEKSYECVKSLKDCDLSSLSKNQKQIMSNFVKNIYIRKK